MDRYKVFPSGELGMHPTGNWTPYADAQAAQDEKGVGDGNSTKV